MRLFKEQEAEYKKRHDRLWPYLAALLHETGIREYNIFLDEATGDLCRVLQIEKAVKPDHLPSQSEMQKWWDYRKDIMAINPDHSPVSVLLKEQFYMP